MQQEYLYGIEMRMMRYHAPTTVLRIHPRTGAISVIQNHPEEEADAAPVPVSDLGLAAGGQTKPQQIKPAPQQAQVGDMLATSGRAHGEALPAPPLGAAQHVAEELGGSLDGGGGGWGNFWAWWREEEEEEVRRPRQWLLDPRWARYTLI